LASFTAAKERVNASKPLTLKSRDIYASASTKIALVYLMQELPTIALDTVEAALAIYEELPELGRSLGRLHFNMGSIHNALGKSDQNLA